ncbi:CHAT domain-containing protein [Calothrix sp. FACHB-1219]|uniref:CHAT domain-containing protein n=1 Tax=Calothrix sp. FACHB-1219 TaxID=2692778 RepID=UPI0016857209|nr:CHAT domain-containing protein [Calothrix sp. FACHB-1219]MBD2202636.1 CHAT domain-containing protein [Calothrix sp. FACHB-168]MBD2221734.1 CHAT domain-containing protein [Calothrix sp. FACHB-1219]
MYIKRKLIPSINLINCWGLIIFWLISSNVSALAETNLLWMLKTGKGRFLVGSNRVNQDDKSPLEEGKILFEASRFAEAAKLWEMAVTNFQQQGDIINQAWILSYLSLAYQNLGEWQKAEKAINNSLNLLQQNKANASIWAIALNTQGHLQLAQGKAETALKTWQKAEQAYGDAGDRVGEIGSQINQSQALQSLGFYSKARNLVSKILENLQNQPDSLLKVQALHSLGVALQVIGDLQTSEKVLQQSLAISDRLNPNADISQILFSLGNNARDLQQTPVALNYYQQAAAKTNNLRVQVEANLNQLSLYLETLQWQQAQSLLAPIKSQLKKLPPSRTSVYAAVNFARSLVKLETENSKESAQYQEAAQILALGIKQAENLGDMRAKAYALTELGGLYLQTQQLAPALQLTQQAQQLAEGMQAADITYQTYWQIGRIRKIQGDIPAAIAAYKLSLDALNLLRSDLVAISQDVQFSFQEKVEPIYRELVDLLLQPNPSQENLKQARKTIEALQLAELDNFFREACLEGKPQQIDQIDQTAAVIYPIILRDRLSVIVSIPGKPLASYNTFLSQAEIENSIKQMRQSLNRAYANEERLRLYQQLYQWLIRPVESELAKSKVKTLAFVLDGSLRNLPMAAMHDGKQYLIQKYSLALSPGMQLLQARSLKGENLQVMIAGLSEARQGFNALPGVQLELKEITSAVNSQLLLNETFTSVNLRQAIQSKPFSVLHLATHAQFSSSFNETFILTWDKKIPIKDLAELIKSRNEDEASPLELLVLSACQTAKGDNRAILGLAGIAVHSRARSTLATLWAVKDESTAKFMGKFYQQLKQPGISKVEALRTTQIAFLQDADFSHPYYWAPFVLVGNWL